MCVLSAELKRVRGRVQLHACSADRNVVGVVKIYHSVCVRVHVSVIAGQQIKREMPFQL